MSISDTQKPTHRRHDMPFGIKLLDDGRTRFGLWAPAAQSVELCLANEDIELSFVLEAKADGWFELSTDAAQAGSRYRYRIDGGICVPDPASRYQADDVHGYSVVVDPETWPWSDHGWSGRPWEQAVIYELHVGTFTPQGTFKAVADKLDYLLSVGVTAIELMPITEFPGRRNWGYDGVLLFAPESSYGTPDDLKYLIQTAHNKGIMVFLDVVYNHFGPEGNYLHHYAPAFFTDQHHTPWGAAINFDAQHSHWVRQYFIHNALYWLQEFHVDGLRLDAVHCIFDATSPDILEELADTVKNQIGRFRHAHLILENDHNAARYLRRDDSGKPTRYAAQWNDDIHHALHVLLTGETQGYYIDYADQPLQHLGRCLSEGFAYQGENSIYRHGQKRGAVSTHLPPTAFVSFLQNHDQIGNRAFGERITTLVSEQAILAATALLLLAPFPPLLFMGQEWGSKQPFIFFCDFEPELAKRVTEGRRQEFGYFPEFADAESRQRIPDPAARLTFQQSLLDWETIDTTQGRQWLDFHQALLGLRKREISPCLPGTRGRNAHFRPIGERALAVDWRLGDGSDLYLLANLGPTPIPITDNKPPGRLLFTTPDNLNAQAEMLPGWSVVWTLQEAKTRGR